MGPIWGRQDPGGPHVGLMNLDIWDNLRMRLHPQLMMRITKIIIYRCYTLVLMNLPTCIHLKFIMPTSMLHSSHCLVGCCITLRLHVSRFSFSRSSSDKLVHEAWNFGFSWKRVGIITTTEDLWRSTAEATKHLLQKQGKVVLFRSIEPIHEESEVCMSNRMTFFVFIYSGISFIFVDIREFQVKYILYMNCHSQINMTFMTEWRLLQGLRLLLNYVLWLKNIIRGCVLCARTRACVCVCND